MIMPEDLIAKAIIVLEDNKETILGNNLHVIETSEDSDKNTIAPYTGIYFDFDQEAETDALNNPKSTPVSVYVTCHSGRYTTAKDSFNEAFRMAVKVAKLLIGSYTVNNINGIPDGTYLALQNVPLVIIKKSADGSVINVQFQYLITDMV